MSATVATMPKAGPRVGTVGVIATCVAALGWLVTGLVAAVPTGMGLAVVAVSDLSTHRYSTRTLGVASAITVVALAADAVVHGSSDHLTIALVGAVGIGAVLGLIWLTTAGLAFGDVPLVAFTIAVPLYVSTQAAVVTLGVTLIVAAGTVLVRTAWQGRGRQRTIALAPALLVGWVCGVMVG